MAKPKPKPFVPEIQLADIESLIPYVGNARTHSEGQVDQIAASIKEFGFTNPILVRQDGIIAGHGRLLGARKLKMERVPVIRLDHLTATQAKALVIADNKIALGSSWDNEMLRSEIEGLREEGVDLDMTGFDLDELSALLETDVEQIETDSDDTGNPPASFEFREWKIEMSHAEANLLERKITEYTEERGTLVGFIGWLANGG